MTGPTDDWNRVNNSFDGAANDAAPETQPIELGAPEGTTATAAPRRRRRWPIVAGAAAVAVVAAGSVAYADARKTVTLDVDGNEVAVTTFASSVDDLLDEQGIAVGARDTVAPTADTALREGSDVVVRTGHELTVQADGESAAVWTTALDADEALDLFASRGDDVRLVASRGSADGRTELPISLDTNGPVNLVVDGKTTTVPEGSIGIDAILADNDIELSDLDRVSVVRDDTKTPAVSLVVERVTVKNEKETKPVAFKTTTVEDSTRYADLGTSVRTAGKKGVYTTVNEVTRVDGKVESTTLVKKGVTTKPVTKVLVEGTKARPEPEPEPVAVSAPSTATSSSSSSSSKASSSSSSTKSSSTSSSTKSSSSSKATGSAPAGVWASLAKCESGGNPATNTGNGYYGLYQFSAQTWHAMGGSGLPSENSAAEQTRIAQKLQAQSGWGQWPGCAAKLGLL